MRNAIWTYPWDVLDIGVEAVVAEIRDRAGLGGISLASSYHAGKFFQPRSKLRKTYFPEDGTIYFRPRSDRFDGLAIQPKVADIVEERGDVLDMLVRERERTGLAVNAWTVCLHNTRLGLLHPEACCRNAFGDVARYNLCPSNPDARAYAVALVAELTHGYAPDAVELESPNFMGYAHEFHHEKDGVGLTPEDDFLLSLCFCSSCQSRAARAGADGEAARRLVRRWIEETAVRALPAPRWPDFVAAGPSVFDAYPEVRDYVRWRFEPVTSLVREIREAAHPASEVRFIDIKGGWLFGSDLAAIASVCDGIVFCAYDAEPVQLARDVADAVSAASGKPVIAGLRLFVPELDGPEKLAAKVHAACSAGAAGCNFYNYGLVPAARLDWVGAALHQAASQRRLG